MVTAVHPKGYAWMASQPKDLRSQRAGGNGEIIGLPRIPLLPTVAAAPSREDQDSHLVRKIEEFIPFQLSFKPNSVQMHIPNVTQFGAEPGFGRAQQHFRRPTCPPDQHRLMIHTDQKRSLVGLYPLGTVVVVENLARAWRLTVKLSSDFPYP